MHEMMTPEEVAQHLHFKTDTVYWLIEKGYLPVHRVGESCHITRENLDSFPHFTAIETGGHDDRFEFIFGLAERENPDGDGDAFLEELEAEDRAKRRQSAAS